MLLTENKVTEIFYLADEFCKEFSKSFETYLIENKQKQKARISYREVISIMILFHFGAFRKCNSISTYNSNFLSYKRTTIKKNKSC